MPPALPRSDHGLRRVPRLRSARAQPPRGVPDGEAAASTAMLTVMPIVVVPCLVGGYWLPRCAGQCSRGKVGVNQTAVDSDGGSTKARGSYWTKASQAGQSYYYRWQTPGLKVKDSTLVLPKEAVLRTEELVELTAFEKGFAEAERMDALRDAGVRVGLNPTEAGEHMADIVAEMG